MTFYDEQTFDAIKDRMMARAPADVDRRDNSSLLYNAIAPAAAEIATEYTELETIRNDMSIYTASDDAVIKHCKDRLIERDAATPATIWGKFNLQNISAGTRFSHDVYNYAIVGYDAVKTAGESDGLFYYRMTCETAGFIPVTAGDALIPIITVRGLTTAEIAGTIEDGTDEQTIDSLRQEYIDSFSMTAFGGNIASYRNFLLNKTSVGGCLVYTATATGIPGSVRVVFTSATHGAPTSELVGQMQEEIDPLEYTAGSVTISDAQGRGLGVAPVGAVVTVAGAQATTINVSGDFTIQAGLSFSDLESKIRAAISEYLTSINETFGTSSRQSVLNLGKNGGSYYLTGLVIRPAQVIAAIVSVDGVVDVADLEINGQDTNLTLPLDNIAVLGTVTNG